ncbi:MAG: glycerol-3-phosphate acyltransferase [Chloroflexota bacterium]|nr:glycerol-3-phosphate acyltransferase [Chloroflexota bacterium]
MTTPLKLFIAWGAAYLLGSLPPGILWAKLLKRIDVRQHGSGRTGGTNVWRTSGWLAALLTAICDGLKGAGGIWIARALGVGPWAVALAGMLGVVGHNYSIYLGFAGGAGTMISIGIAGALWGGNLPLLVLLAVAAGGLVGHASVASILIALALPGLSYWHGGWPTALGFGLPTLFLTLWALRPNIQRLFKREERFLPLFYKKPPLVQISKHTPRE